VLSRKRHFFRAESSRVMSSVGRRQRPHSIIPSCTRPP
jgi:hypothetical protein